MFKTAATKIAHNSTIPALAGNSDLRQLQDLINAEKVVLVSIQRLGVDLTKAAESLRAWGVGEGDDLADILGASTTLLVNFAAALSAYASAHHGMRDTMKAVRTREEALDDLRRRRRRVGAAADSAEKKLSKMSPEHKNLASQTDALNRLREDMRAMDGEIVRDEAELGDFKRRCAKSWMQAKFGGLAECCEKGLIVGDIGKAIVAEIPEDVTQPGLPRAYYNSHPHVSSLVSEAQRSIAQVTFTPTPSSRVGQRENEYAARTSLQVQANLSPLSHSPYLPTPQVGSTLHMSGFGDESPSTPSQNQRAASADELGVSTPTSTYANHFASVPVRGSSRGVLLNDVSIPAPLPLQDNSDSLTHSIADALALRDPDVLGPSRPAVDDPAPKYEPIASNSEAPCAGVEDMRRSKSKSPCLPPGAAPAAIRAWDIEEQRAMSESNDHAMSDVSAGGNEQTMSITGRSDRRTSQESEVGMPYDRDEESESFSQEGDFVKIGTEEGEIQAETTKPSHGRTESQRRIPRVPPPIIDTDTSIPSRTAGAVSPLSQQPVSPQLSDATSHTQDDDDEHVRNAAAAREVSRELDALAFSTPAPVTYSTHPTQSRSRQRGSYTPGQAYPPPHQHPLPAVPQIYAPQQMPNQVSQPPSPLTPPHAPFAHRPHPHVSVDPGEIRPLSNIVSQRNSSPRPTSLRLQASSVQSAASSSVQSLASMHYRTPPEYPRPQPPFSSPLMAKSTSSLTTGAPGGVRTIPAAAFRRPARNGSESSSILSPLGGPADTSPLSFRRGAAPPTSSRRNSGTMPTRRLSVINPDPVQPDEDEFDYISAYMGREEAGGAHARQSG